MGRHGSGQSNYRIAGWIWIALAAVLALVAVVIAWTVVDNRNTQDLASPQCTGESYRLAVWASPEVPDDTAKKLVEGYNSTNPEAMDTCIEAELVAMPDDDAVQRYREWTTEIPEAEQPAGVWIPGDADRALGALGESPVVIRDKAVPVIAGNHPVLTPQLRGEAPMELKQRASDLLVDYAEDEFGAESDNGSEESVRVVPLEEIAPNGAAAVAATGDEASREDDGAEQGARANNENDKEKGEQGGDQDKADNPRADGGLPAQDVTFVLDTSGSMGLIEGNTTRMDNVRGPLADSMHQVGANGGAVALWNYSSPISPRAQNPYRDNVDIMVRDDGDTSVAALNALGFGGATHTYSSILAAYGSAAAGAERFDATAKSNNTTPLPGKVVLMTDGPNDGGRATLEQAVSQIRARFEATGVKLEVVAIGDRVDRGALDQLAGAAGGSVFPAADSLQVAPALRAALEA